MIAQASGLGMRIAMFSKQLCGVGVLSMSDVGLDTTRHVESVCVIPLGAGVLRLLVTTVPVGVIIDCHCAADAVEITL